MGISFGGFNVPAWKAPSISSTGGTSAPAAGSPSITQPPVGATGSGSQSSGGTSQAPQPTSVEIVKSIVDTTFSLVNVAASLPSSQMYRVLAASGVTQATQLSVVTAYRGSILALALSATENKTGGTATFQVFINGVAVSGATLTWVDSTSSNQVSFRAGTYPFSAGDKIDVRITTSAGFTPTTADVEVMLYLSQNPESS